MGVKIPPRPSPGQLKHQHAAANFRALMKDHNATFKPKNKRGVGAPAKPKVIE